MQHALKVCDAYNEVQRIKEELQLLPQEMLAHLRYWEWVLDKQDRLIALLSTPVSSAEAQQRLAQELHAAGMKVCRWLDSAASASTLWLVVHQTCCAVTIKSNIPASRFECTTELSERTTATFNVSVALMPSRCCPVSHVPFCCLQAGMAGRYLPPCDELAADQRARQGAICVLRVAQQEAARHLALAVQSFQRFNIGAGVAAAQAVLNAAAEVGGASGSTAMNEAADGEEDGDDAELGYSEDEGCTEAEADLAAAVSDSSGEGSEEGSNGAMDAE